MAHEQEIPETPTPLYAPDGTMTGLDVPVSCSGCDWLAHVVVTDPEKMQATIRRAFMGHISSS